MKEVFEYRVRRGMMEMSLAISCEGKMAMKVFWR
jgi:hypothetical protein